MHDVCRIPGAALAKVYELASSNRVLKRAILNTPEATLAVFGITLEPSDAAALTASLRQVDPIPLPSSRPLNNLLVKLGHQGAKPLVFAGVDLIRYQDRWKVLEVNDRPAGLLHADWLAANTETPFAGDATARLAAELLRLASGQPVGFLLPDAMRILGEEGTARRLSPKQNYGVATVSEFNALASMVESQRAQAIILDRRAVAVKDGKVFVGSTQMGSIYSRSSSFPDCDVTTPIIGDLRARLVCLDKAAASDLLVPALGTDSVVEHKAFASVDSAEHWLSSLEDSAYVCIKPRLESAGSGVHRIRKVNVYSALSALVNNESSPNVFSRWLSTDTISRGRFSYRYSMTVHIINGSAVAGYLRVAPAPADGIAAESELSWVTNLGGTAPLQADRVPDLRAALELAEKSVAAIQEAVRSLSNHEWMTSGYLHLQKLAELRGQVGYNEVQAESPI